MYGPEDCHELRLTYLHYVRLTKAITCWEVPLIVVYFIDCNARYIVCVCVIYYMYLNTFL